MYIYLSNENETPVEVFFDDFRVAQVPGPVVQMDDYYPFGLTFNSYYRESSVKNKYLYNAGSELQDDLDLGVYETYYRMLDPANGRWWQVDPMVDEMYSWSPYNYSFNNPIRYNDPKGDCPTCPARDWEIEATADGQMGAGLVESVTDAAKGLWSAVTNPIGTAFGILEATANPIQTGITVSTQMATSAVENPGKFTGKVIGNVLMTVATMGTAAEVKATTDVAKTTTLATRAQEIHSVLDPIASKMRTTAVTEAVSSNGNVFKVVGSSNKTLTPKQISALKPGEIPATGLGHAEVTTLNTSKALGLKPVNTAASRGICPECLEAIKNAGSKPVSPLKR